MQVKRHNPYNSEIALMNSSYAAFQNGRLVYLLDQEKSVFALAEFVHGQIRALFLEPKFVCVGAMAAINEGTYRFGMYGTMDSSEATAGLCRDLFAFVDEQDEIDSNFTTFIASFSSPNPNDEKHFEHLVWNQLQSLHDHDLCVWDTTVSSDPEDPHFSFSFAGRAFFIVGLHASSARWSRRFAWPTLVFNAHHQFEELREASKFEQFQKIIQARDRLLQGTININLANFGEASEARQYSGRPVDEAWKCPLKVRKKDSTTSEKVQV